MAATPAAPALWRNWLVARSLLILIVYELVMAVCLLGLVRQIHLGLLFAIGLALFSLFLFWGWQRLLLALGILAPAGERACGIARATAARVNQREPSVLEIKLPSVNALAYFNINSLAFTTPALAMLADDELAVVTAHKLAHLSEPPRIKAVRIGVQLAGVSWILGSVLGIVALTRAAEPPNGIILLLAPLGYLLALIVLLKFRNRLSRWMEVRADAFASQVESEPGLYARALERIYELNRIPDGLNPKKLTHPDLHDRLSASDPATERARPKPPPRWPYLAGILAAALVAAAGIRGLSSLEEVWTGGAIEAADGPELSREDNSPETEPDAENPSPAEYSESP